MPIGVITNCVSVFVGGAIGSKVGNKIPPHIKQYLPTVFGFVAITMGIIKISSTQNMLVVTLSVLLGTLIGEWIGIDRMLRKWAGKSFQRFALKNGNDGMDLFILAAVAFCMSGTGIFGALEEGFSGDASILLSKASLDFLTAILFSSVAGFSIAMLSIPQAAFMVLLYLIGGIIAPLLSPAVTQNFLAVGGVITMMNGFVMANISKIKSANVVPALIIVLLISRII